MGQPVWGKEAEGTSVSQDSVQQAFEWNRCLECPLVPTRKLVTTQTPSPGDTRTSYSFLRAFEMKPEEVSQDTQNADSPPTRGARVPRTCSVAPGLKALTWK